MTEKRLKMKRDQKRRCNEGSEEERDDEGEMKKQLKRGTKRKRWTQKIQ